MSVISQTLAEQMQVTERELEQRKTLVQFDSSDVEILRAHRIFIAEVVDDIVEQFYTNQLAVPEISLLIGDSDTMTRLRRAMRRYILELFDGYYDIDYVNRRLRIGKVHKEIGVSPKLFISGIWLLEKYIKEKINAYSAQVDSVQSGEKLKDALHKLLMLDTQFVFDTYISSLVTEVSIAKSQMEEQIEQLENMISERTQELETLSRRDGLTGLWNQNAFHEYLHHEMAYSERYKENISLAYIDVDRFKKLNDTKGHVVGDQVLCQLANAIKETIRDCDIACRVGGDEFAIIFPKTTLIDAHKICERLTDRLKTDLQDKTTVSIGIATAGEEHYLSVSDFIRHADRKMYTAKNLSVMNNNFNIN